MHNKKDFVPNPNKTLNNRTMAADFTRITEQSSDYRHLDQMSIH